MEYGERKFCVGIDVDDETVLWDNYQRAEIDAALQEYFMELYGLPKAYKGETVFRLEDAPNYHVVTPLEWREKGYDHANMVDFYFEGQPAEELEALPEGENRREYKIYSNGTCGMSEGYEYVVAEKVREDGT